MATGSLYGSVSESTGLYGIGAASGGTYFEWFIFQDSATAPATPTGGSWSFTTNTGTAPAGWVASPPASPVNQVWVSLAIVDSRSTSALTWSVPGLMSNFGNSVANYLTFVATSAPAYSAGRLWYDTTQKALSYYNDVTNNIVHIGQETQLKVHNNTGASITKGAPVYITNTSIGNTFPNIALAQANTLTTSNCIGLVNETIASGADGYVVISGILNGINTGTFTVGDVLYLSPYSAGQLMNSVPPTGYAVRIGVVSYSNTPSGSIYINESFAFTQAGNIVGTVAIGNGGTGATTASAARTSLGLGTVATQDANNVAITGGSITGITDLAIADGGTGASTAGGALANLGAVGLTDTQTLTNKTISGSSNTLSNIGNASLTNSSVTINGSAIALGGGATITASTPNSLVFGAGLSASGNFNGSVATNVNLGSVGTAGTYGSSSNIPVIVTDVYGRVTSATNTPVSIPAGQVTGLGTMSTQNSNNVNITGGTIQSTGSTFTNSGWINGSITNATITGGSVSGLATPLALASGGTGATTQADARTNLGLGTVATFNAAVANGAATLDASGYLTPAQIPPSIVTGASYRGTWNASTNTPTLTSSVGTQGFYYIVATAGSTTLNGISSWAVGDTVIFNGSVWQKITQNTIISGGSINNTPIGSTTPSTGNFTVLTENGSPAVVQTDIGSAPNEIPLNQYLGNLAYQDAANIAGPVGVGGPLTVVGAASMAAATVTNAVSAGGGVTGNQLLVDNFTASSSAMLRGGSTNILTYSEQFDNAAWTKSNSTVTANTIVAPDGSLTADKLVEDTATNAHYLTSSLITFGSFPSGVVFSCYAKTAERSKFLVGFSQGGNLSQTNCIFDLVAKTATSTNAFGWPVVVGTITDVGNGWFRCNFRVSTGGSAYNPNPTLAVIGAAGTISYTGDGTSGVYIWGAQINAGSTPQGYLKTVETAVTTAYAAPLESPNGLALPLLSTMTPARNSDMTFQLTSNTSLVIKVKGSDGTVRSATLTLA
jgi:hypothetical protein